MMKSHLILRLHRIILIAALFLAASCKEDDTSVQLKAPQTLTAIPSETSLLIEWGGGDEAASIDGCGSFRTLVRILMPLCKPALVSVGLFNFIWTWNAFMDPLIYISSVKKYPLSLALRMTLDLGSAAAWNEIFAMSVLSILPPVLLFFAGQKYFIQGISTSGLKG